MGDLFRCLGERLLDAEGIHLYACCPFKLFLIFRFYRLL
jgi:hypothetical protein